MTSQLNFRETGPCWVCGGTALTRFHEAMFDSRRGASRIRSLPPTPGERSGCRRCAAAASLSPSAFRRCRVSSIGCTTSAGLETGSRRSSSRTYKDLIFGGILDALGERVRSTPRTLLDVGCHAGRFCSSRRGGLARRRNRDQPATAAYAAARTGTAGPSIQRRAAAGARQQFDAVTLTDVLEHIPDPVALLSRAALVCRRRVARRQGALRASAAAEGDLARAPRPELSRHARRQSRARQPLFPAALRQRARARGFRRRDRRDWSARESARRAWIAARSGWRSTASAVAARGGAHAARVQPAGVRARATAQDARPGRTRDRPVRPDGRHPDVQQRGGPPAMPDQLAAPAPPDDVEIIVIEDGCRDGTRAFLEAGVSRVGTRHLRWMHLDDAHELRCTNAGCRPRARR